MAEQKYTKNIDGSFMLDGSGNKIPVELWENSPSDRMFELVNSQPQSVTDDLIEELGLNKKP